MVVVVVVAVLIGARRPPASPRVIGKAPLHEPNAAA